MFNLVSTSAFQRAGVTNPLIVDEPTVCLDPEERVRFRNLIAGLSGERIIILSTHIVSDVEATATSIAIMNAGLLITHALPEQLLQAVEGKVWRQTIDKLLGKAGWNSAVVVVSGL